MRDDVGNLSEPEGCTQFVISMRGYRIDCVVVGPHTRHEFYT